MPSCGCSRGDEEQAESVSQKTHRKKTCQEMPLPSAGCHFYTKTGMSKITYSKKNILPPVTSFDILKIVCQEAEKALVARPCVLVQVGGLSRKEGKVDGKS